MYVHINFSIPKLTDISRKQIFSKIASLQNMADDLATEIQTETAKLRIQFYSNDKLLVNIRRYPSLTYYINAMFNDHIVVYMICYVSVCLGLTVVSEAFGGVVACRVVSTVLAIITIVQMAGIFYCVFFQVMHLMNRTATI